MNSKKLVINLDSLRLYFKDPVFLEENNKYNLPYKGQYLIINKRGDTGDIIALETTKGMAFYFKFFRGTGKYIPVEFPLWGNFIKSFQFNETIDPSKIDLSNKNLEFWACQISSYCACGGWVDIVYNITERKFEVGDLDSLCNSEFNTLPVELWELNEKYTNV